MRILISNDDGYQAPGLICLVQIIKEIAEITVVAPERDRSGASNSLTLDYPIKAICIDKNFYRVDGTPTDCVHLAITGLLDQEPDMVLSGINSGANLGDDVIYSGTVAAAIEGRFLGLPSIAISLANIKNQYYETAAEIARLIVINLQKNPLPGDMILNINVPDLPLKDIKGFKATRLGKRHKAESVVCSIDPRGRNIYWIGPAGPEQDAGEGTDFYAVNNNYVSVTPIHIDLTRYNVLDNVNNWLKSIN